MRWLWQIVGASQIALGFSHLLMWRAFGWSRELAQLRPLTARVFATHTFFIAFALVLLGALEVGRPDLLEMPSELARFGLSAATLFWLLRFAAQLFVFDPVLLLGSRWRAPLRIAALMLFALYTGVYGFALAQQR